MSCCGLPPNPYAPTKEDWERITMKDTHQIKEIAKLDGWNDLKLDKMRLPGGSPHFTGNKKDDSSCFVPEYLVNRDAIVPVIERQIRNSLCNQLPFVQELDKLISKEAKSRYPLTIFATSRQLCEALLRATGKWKD